MKPNPILDAALSYARRGWRVFALDGKVPFAGTKGFLDATADENKIRDMWARWPKANVGIATGSVSGVVVVDIDGEVGAESWRSYQIANGEEKQTLKATTRRGYHLYFAQPVGITTRNQASGELGQGVDVRGDGGYVVAPPSIHPESKTPYVWENQILCAAPSDDLLAKVRADRPRERRSTAENHLVPSRIFKGSRDAGLTRVAGQMRWLGMSAEEMYHALTAVNRERCSPPLEEQEVLKIAQSIGKKEPGRCNPMGQVNDAEIVGARASSVVPKPVTWRWPSFLPRGVLVIWAGDPGHGKSLMSCYLAAKVTRGEKLIGDETPEQYAPEHVLMLSAEDDYDTTVRPRLELAGADLDRVTFLDVMMSNGKPLSLPEHLVQLTGKIEETKATLIIIDPLDAFLGEGVDSYKNADVRKMLAPVKSICEKTKATLLIVMHLNKSKESTALHRVGGSGAFVAAPRASFVFGDDPTVEGEHVFACAKINIAKKPKSLRYAVESKYVVGIGDVPYITWRGESSETADSITMIPSNGHGGREAPRDDAKKFLETILNAGPVVVRRIQDEAKAAGITMRTLRRAKDEMKIQIRQSASHVWQWALADHKWERQPGEDEEVLFDPFEAER